MSARVFNGESTHIFKRNSSIKEYLNASEADLRGSSTSDAITLSVLNYSIKKSFKTL